MTNYLFGNILWASKADIYMLLGLDALVLSVTALMHRRFLAICFDENQATLQAQNVKLLYFLLLSLVASYRRPPHSSGRSDPHYCDAIPPFSYRQHLYASPIKDDVARRDHRGDSSRS